MQNVGFVKVFNGPQQFQKHVLDIGRCEMRAIGFDDLQQFAALNEIKRHIGGAIVLEHLMHADNVGMAQLCQTAGFLAEQRHDRLEIRLQAARPCLNHLVAAPTHRIGIAFLDHHLSVQTVQRKIGYAETARPQIAFDPVLPPQL